MRLLKSKYSSGILITLVTFLNLNVLTSQIVEETEKYIKIGLLIPNNNSLEAKFAAEWAIRKANENGGINGRSFQLITRSMEGSWGTGSKEAVDLVFKEKVWAILGSQNGRNTHLVEQVIAKTNMVFLSAWASDPTLSQAFVPWYFTCVPNDIQQAKALIEEIYNNRKINNIAIVSDKTYDSRLAFQFLLKELKNAGKKEPIQLFYDNSDKIFEKIDKAGIHGIILLGKGAASMSFMKQLGQKEMHLPVFGTLSLLGEDAYENLRHSPDNITIVTSGNWIETKELIFQNEFQKKYGKIPGATAAYAFDGMNLIIESIKNSGLDREKVQEAMSKIHYSGVTGSIRFNERGVRTDTPKLVEIINGIPATKEK